MEDLNKSKDMFRKEMSKRVLPMLPWEVVDEIMEQVELDLIKDNVKKASSGNEAGGEGY